MNANMDRFAARSDADLVRLVRQQPLAWVVSGGAENLRTTLLPVLAQTNTEGRLTALIGHFARSNDHYPSLVRDRRATILVLGTNGYMSPSWLQDRTQAPTWNYASAQFIVDIEFFDAPNAIEAHLRQLVDAMESRAPRAAGSMAWNVDQMGARYAVRVPLIIGFVARIREVRAKFKLGQDERDDHFRDMMAGLSHGPAAELHAWMNEFNPGRT